MVRSRTLTPGRNASTFTHTPAGAEQNRAKRISCAPRLMAGSATSAGRTAQVTVRRGVTISRQKGLRFNPLKLAELIRRGVSNRRAEVVVAHSIRSASRTSNYSWRFCVASTISGVFTPATSRDIWDWARPTIPKNNAADPGALAVYCNCYVPMD